MLLPLIAALVLSVVTPLISLQAGLVSAFLIGAAGLIHARVTQRPITLLETGACVLAGALALSQALFPASLSLPAARAILYGGVALLALGSVLAGRPFTLVLARLRAPPEVHSSPMFHRINARVSLAWAAAFGLACAADLAILSFATLPSFISPVTLALCFMAAAYFSRAYPALVRARLQASFAAGAAGAGRPMAPAGALTGAGRGDREQR